MVVDFN
jgi:hypothetical protein